MSRKARIDGRGCALYHRHHPGILAALRYFFHGQRGSVIVKARKINSAGLPQLAPRNDDPNNCNLLTKETMNYSNA